MTCGEGRELRNVVCSGPEEHPFREHVAEAHCDLKTRPSSEKPCFADACPVNYHPSPMSDQSNMSQEYDWLMTEWSEVCGLELCGPVVSADEM